MESLVGQAPDPRPGPYYVSIVRNGGTPSQRVGLLAGPFAAHEVALATVDVARELAQELDPWAAFDAFGTVRIEGFTKPGALNERLGLATVTA